MNKALLLLFLPVMAFAQMGGDDAVFGEGQWKLTYWTNIGDSGSASTRCPDRNSSGERYTRCYINIGCWRVQSDRTSTSNTWTTTTYQCGTQEDDPSQTLCYNQGNTSCLPGVAWSGYQMSGMNPWMMLPVGGCATTHWGCDPGQMPGLPPNF